MHCRTISGPPCWPRRDRYEYRIIAKAARAADYLGHILQAIGRIDRYTANMVETQFLASDITQDAVIRNFEIIGEASRNIERNCPEFAAAHRDLPALQRQITSILEGLESHS